MKRKPGPDVVGPAEARKLLGGISGARLHQLRQHPRFPVARTLTIGNVWDRAEVQAFHEARMRPTRTTLPVLLQHYRVTGSVARSARVAGVTPTTARKWLRELDVPLPSEL